MFYRNLIFVLFFSIFLSCSDDLYVEPALKIPTINIEINNFEEINSKDDYVKGTFEFNSRDYDFEDFVQPIKIRGRGNSTWDMPKKSYQFKLEEKHNLFNFPKDKKWLMLANYSDKTMLRNALAFELGYLSKLDWTPNYHFAEVVINGKAKGLYQFTEKVETGDDNRVKIGDEGFLLEVDQLSRIDYDDISFWTEKKLLFVVKDPDLESGSSELKKIKSYVIQTENVLYSKEFDDPFNGYSKYIDVDSFVDWYLINEISKNNDAIFFSSVYMNYVQGGKLKMGPIWDFDIAFGNINYNNNEKIDGFYVKNAPWIERLFQDKSFVEKVKSRYNYFYSNKNIIIDKLNYYSEQLAQARFNNENIWKILGKYVWPNNVTFNSSWSSSPFKEEQNYLNSWISDRMDWLNVEIKKL
jgi:spore coat protein CotH